MAIMFGPRLARNAPALNKGGGLAYIRANWTGYKKPASIYSVWNGLWGMFEEGNQDLVEGVDYEIVTKYNPSTMPNGLEQSGFVPKTIQRVWGSPGVSAGNGDWAGQAVPLPPARIYEISAFNLAYDIDVTSENDWSTMLHECWPTETPHDNDALTDKVAEPGWFPDPTVKTLEFVGGATLVGNWTDPAGIEWTITRTTNPQGLPYLQAVPTDGVRRKSGVLYYGHYLNHLCSLEIFDARSYLNGVMAVIEPIWGTFRAKYNLFEVQTYTHAARVPHSPGVLDGVAISSTVIQLSFTVANGAESYEYTLNGGGSWTALAGDKQITGLAEDTSYTIQVRGVNDFGGAGAGKGAASNAITRSTEDILSGLVFRTPALVGTGTFTNSNQTASIVAGNGNTIAAASTSITGKKVFAVTFNVDGGFVAGIGLSTVGSNVGGIGADDNRSVSAFSNGVIYINGGSQGAGGPTYAQGDTIGCVVDEANDDMWFTKDGVNFYGNTTSLTRTQVEAGTSGLDISAVKATGALCAAVGSIVTGGSQFTFVDYPWTMPSGYSQAA